MVERGRTLFLLASLGVVLVLFGGSMLASTSDETEASPDSLYKNLSIFTEVLSLVQRAYVDPVETEELMTGAFEGAADALDPFSMYIPEDLVESWPGTAETAAARSGLVVVKERGAVFVLSVVEGSPADRAGLERGNIVSEVDGERTRTAPLARVLDRLAGEPGSEVDLEVLALAEKRQVTLTLEDGTPPGVVLEVRRGVPVLRIHGFHGATFDNVARSLDELAGLEGVERDGVLLLDLREVAGGDDRVAYRVGSLFAKGEIGVLKARDEVLERFQGSLEPRWAGDLVILVNRSTQGPAEVLASVLRQSANARLVGEATFGHAGRTSLLALSNGARLQLTDAFFTGPDLEALEEGLVPDLRVRPALDIDDDGEERDIVLDRGLAVLLGEEEIAPAVPEAA